ncbi:MAG: DUF4347 domain-containing protein [Methyloceanibacter sp.]|uniref:DUF4347 domain-containing protein n=1 Tax=Methyloceanibacter sp. TaxID=1965321 RepID=UPI003D6CDE4E
MATLILDQPTNVSSLPTGAEIVFVDSNIASLNTLLSGVRPDLQKVVLSPGRSALGEIADALRGRTGLEAIHIVAHGAPGEVQFASGTLTRHGLGDHAAELATIGQALAAGGRLLLWSCETGQGERGREFVAALEELVGADILAAAGLVGSPWRGGSWELPQAQAGAAAHPPLTAAALSAYPGIMQDDSATAGVDNIVQPASDDNLFITSTSGLGHIGSSDFFNGTNGFDTIVLNAGSGAIYRFDFATTTATTGFHNYEALTFASSGFSLVVARAEQFDDGLLSNSLRITGNTGMQQFLIDGSNISAAGWTFVNWNSAEDRIEFRGTAGVDTLTGSSQNDIFSLSREGNDVINGMGGFDIIEYGHSAGYSIQRVDEGGTTSWLITDTNPGDGDEGTDTLTNIEQFNFSNVDVAVTSLISALADANPAVNSVKEGAATGTLAGFTALAIDGSGETVTYSLVNNAGGRFQIDSTTGVVTVANGGAALDFETAKSHTITIRATSDDGSFTQQPITIAVGNISPENFTGTNASETINGNSDVNTISGLGGNDTLRGFANKDTLIGGKGRDTLFGGADADRFDFNSIKESVRGSKRDKIMDFGGKDKIDLKDIDAKSGSGNQKFKWIGKKDFSDEKGELRYEDKGATVIVQGDTNGDGKADFEIFVNIGSLAKGDFVL